jgi:hypothetical protein
VGQILDGCDFKLLSAMPFKEFSQVSLLSHAGLQRLI